MAIGTYKTSIASGYTNTNYSNSGTYLIYGSFNISVVLRSVFFYTSGTASDTKAVLYNSSGVKLHQSTVKNATVVSGNEREINFDTPFVLQAGQSYYIGFYTDLTYDKLSTNSVINGSTFPSTPVFANFSPTVSYRASNVDSTSGITSISPVISAISFDNPNTIPTAPTNVAVTNSPVPTGTSPIVTWTHNDPDNNPQSKYQIRWRKKD